MELMNGFKIGKVQGKNRFALFIDNEFTNLFVDCDDVNTAIEVFNDHIPLLEGCILEEPVIIRKNNLVMSK